MDSVYTDEPAQRTRSANIVHQGARPQSVVEPSPDVETSGIRHSSKRVPSWLDLNISDTRHDGPFADILGTFKRHKRTKRPGIDAETFADGGVVTTPDTKV